MAIVNGIVTIIKAIINVRPLLPLHPATASPEPTTDNVRTGHCGTLHGPRLVLDLRQGGKARKRHDECGLSEVGDLDADATNPHTLHHFTYGYEYWRAAYRVASLLN
ncbi:hypothetical protein LTR82_002988 [Friedmanniomyces endolithicus]|uniref:Uncharacterized protein n=1 Tax=Friedmanniomyces endolithicus TaxID=329885 RepID=A0AAN6FZC4_9PEZI|nr:hypothetical protein LTR82_002988 [Friedmanniomyces endolithicus]